MADNNIPAIAFNNGLAYDVIVYDSFDNDDDDSGSSSGNDNNGKPDSQAYFATLTQLGKVPAGQTVSLQPIHDSSAFVVESATDSKPVKRMVALSFDDVTSLSIVQDDVTAMTQTFQFINFFLNSPNDPLSVAFNKVLNNTTDDLATGIDNFFAAQPSYSKCSFEDYMMALAYTALHPPTPNPSQPAGTSSLKIISDLMGSKWSALLSDIFVTKFTCTTQDKKLILTFEVDISTLPFESVDIASNVLTIFGGTKVVKAQILFNYAIGLNIFGTRLSLLLDAITLPVGGGKTYAIQKPQASIDINPLFKFVVFTMKGTFPFNVNGKTFDALASFVIDNDEAAIGVDIQGDKSSLPPPPGLKGLHFDEFGVGMGLFFKPPGFGLGIQGKFHIGDSSTNVISLDDDTFAVVCEFVEEAIDPKYVAFSVPQLSLNQVIELFTNANPNIDVPVSFTDLSFHWSDGLMDAVVLPDGTLSNGGYGFSAAVNIFSFGFYGEMNLDLNNGLTADVEVSPINWKNVFKLTGDGKGYSLKYDAAGNPIRNNFVPTTQAEKDAVANATTKQIVAPGGACLIINTLTQPILHLNAKASLFDLADYAITADINKSGITFLLDYGIVLKEKMTVTLSAWHNLAASFTYYINQSITVPPVAGMNLGTFTLSADVAVHFAMATSLTDVTLSVGGAFDFLNLHRSFGDFTADINITKITDFLKAIGEYIEQHAKDIFSDFLNDAQQWANKVKSGFLTGCDEVGSVIKNVWHGDSIAVAAIMKKAGYAIDDISRNIKNAWNCAATDVTYALKAVGYTANEIAVSLKNVFNAASQDVAAALKAMGFAVNEIGGAIKNAWNCGINDVTWALNEVGFNPDQITSALRSAFNASAQDVASALKAFGVAYDKIANVLKNDFACDVRTCATYLKNLGYSATQIVGVLKNIYGLVYLDCTQVLKDVGILANDAAAGLQWVWAAATQDIGTGFKMVGYIASDTANALKNVYHLAINDTAAVLKQAGYVASDVASALQGAFNTSVDAVADAMKQVGYAANDVKNAFDELGGDFKSFADDAWGDAKHYLNPSNW